MRNWEVMHNPESEQETPCAPTGAMVLWLSHFSERCAARPHFLPSLNKLRISWWIVNNLPRLLGGKTGLQNAAQILPLRLFSIYSIDALCGHGNEICVVSCAFQNEEIEEASTQLKLAFKIKIFGKIWIMTVWQCFVHFGLLIISCDCHV